MKNRTDPEELFRRKEQSRKLRAKKPIAEKLEIAEELRDLQKALAESRKVNRLEVLRKRDQPSD